MREVVLGVTENLHLRAEQKNVLRVPTTTIQPQNNNPLKFAASVEEALNDLLFRDSAEYLSAVDAVRETFGDIKQHQQHMLAAVRTAVVDYVGRLDPEELESKVSNGRVGALINAANKLKYWDLFKDLYQVVAQRQPGQFPHQFIEELARAYELEESRAVSPVCIAPSQARLSPAKRAALPRLVRPEQHDREVVRLAGLIGALTLHARLDARDEPIGGRRQRTAANRVDDLADIEVVE